MRIEPVPSVNCVRCQGRLILESHEEIWVGPEFKHAFTFQCESCKRKYWVRDGIIRPKEDKPDPVAQAVAIRRAEHEAVRTRRCISCGGPVLNGRYGLFVYRCQWCNAEYVLQGGELVPKPSEPVRKPTLREFADALHDKQR